MPFTKTFHGFIENTTDSLLIIEACRSGVLPTINRRLIERERHSIKSGTIIVFNETESGIKRWTDGFVWSPSRILGNFLVYRQLENREHRQIDNDFNFSHVSAAGKISSDLTVETNISLMQQRERALVGSLTTSNTTYNFKKDGLIKKTIRIMVNGNFLHIVNYYSKNDALNNLLPTPSTSPELACLQISADLMPHLQDYQPSSSSQDTLISRRKRSKSSDDSDYLEQAYQNNRPYNINYSNLMYASIPTSDGNMSSFDMYSRPSFSGTLTSEFNSNRYHGNSSSSSHGSSNNNKRNKPNQATATTTLSPSLSPTPIASYPAIVSSPPSSSSSCGDTAKLANRFNQFYNPSFKGISNRNHRNTDTSTGAYTFTTPRRATFDNY